MKATKKSSKSAARKQPGSTNQPGSIDTHAVACDIVAVGEAIRALRFLGEAAASGSLQGATLAACIDNMVPTMYRNLDAALEKIGERVMGSYSDEETRHE